MMDGPNYPQITVLWVAHAYTLQLVVPVISISQSHICLSQLVLTTHRYTVEEEVGAFDRQGPRSTPFLLPPTTDILDRGPPIPK